MQLIDLRGKRFGTLVVLERGPNDGQATAWNCRCECGRSNCRLLLLVRGSNLKSGNTTSCGGTPFGDSPSSETWNTRHAKHQRNWRQRHPEKVNKWRRAHPDRVRSMHLKAKFGLTLVEWEALFESQGRCCAACGSEDPGFKGKRNNWVTDHDHATGEMRGIICGRCNIVLGWLGDTLKSVRERSQHLIMYLTRFERRPYGERHAALTVNAQARRDRPTPLLPPRSSTR